MNLTQPEGYWRFPQSHSRSFFRGLAQAERRGLTQSSQTATGGSSILDIAPPVRAQQKTREEFRIDVFGTDWRSKTGEPVRQFDMMMPSPAASVIALVAGGPPARRRCERSPVADWDDCKSRVAVWFSARIFAVAARFLQPALFHARGATHATSRTSNSFKSVPFPANQQNCSHFLTLKPETHSFSYASLFLY